MNINMTTGEVETQKVETQNKIVVLKAELFDILRQIDYLSNLRVQKLNELNVLEQSMNKT